MNKKRALIFGISGQDGSYLSEYLLSLGYEVWGMIRRHSVTENQNSRIDHIIDHPDLHLEYGSMSDVSSIENLIKKSNPDEIYNLAAQSHVRISADIPLETQQTNALGVGNLLECYRKLAPNARLYQASSSEMFGNNVNTDGSQSEFTPMEPVSVYGCTKLFSFNLVKYYRRAHGLFAANGILFNHESPRRGSNFVTTKVVKTAVEISLGMANKLMMGNLDSFRDWGFSGDYVKAMHAILNHSEPDDFVIATGVTHSVREMCEYVFGKLGLNYKDYVDVDPKFFRAEELQYLRGDASKARDILKWSPEHSFEDLLDMMIEHWQSKLGGSKTVTVNTNKSLHLNING
jgi:GDPmannose 4,6-dehydratase